MSNRDVIVSPSGRGHNGGNNGENFSGGNQRQNNDNQRRDNNNQRQNNNQSNDNRRDNNNGGQRNNLPPVHRRKQGEKVKVYQTVFLFRFGEEYFWAPAHNAFQYEDTLPVGDEIRAWNDVDVAGYMYPMGGKMVLVDRDVAPDSYVAITDSMDTLYNALEIAVDLAYNSNKPRRREAAPIKRQHRNKQGEIVDTWRIPTWLWLLALAVLGLGMIYVYSMFTQG